jgi:hypothetical protein
MSFLIIYAVAMIIGLTVYLFSNNDLSISDFYDTYKFLKEGIIKLTFKEEEFGIEVKINKTESSAGVVLNKNLKHLEFISQLEPYMESTESVLLSSEFLQEFESSKLNTQLSVLKSTQILNASNRIAA